MLQPEAATSDEEKVRTETDMFQRITKSNAEEVPKKVAERATSKRSWKYFGNWQKNSVSQLKQAATPCIGDHHLEKEDFEIVGRVKNASLDRIGRPDILWTADALA